MPIYEYLCPTHGRFEGWATIADRHQSQACSKCAVPAPFAISAPRVFGDFEGYVSPATGNWIEGRKARTEDFAVSGCRPHEAGEMKDAQERSRLNEAATECAVDEAVERTFVELKNG